MPTSLTPNSRIIKAITSHIETGIPLDSENYNLNPDEIVRLRAVIHLYKAWRKNPLINKTVFLKTVHNRRAQDIPNDMYCFEHIRNLTSDLTISRADAEFIMDKYTKKLLQAGDATGDPHLWESGLKMLGKYHKLDKEAPPEDVASRTAELPYAFTRDIRVIDPDREIISVEHKNAILAKYGGTPDATAEAIRRKKEQILGVSTPPVSLDDDPDEDEE